MMSPSSYPVALVTGGAQRIGAAIVAGLHAEQYRVIIHYHQSAQQARSLAHACECIRPESATTLSANLCEYHDLTALVQAAHRAWGRLDVLINNASRFYPTPIEKTQKEQWDGIINSNLMAPYFLSQAAYPHLLATQGCIINISDIKARRPLSGYSLYWASQAGLNMLTQALALEMAPNVRVNGVAPGVTLWPKDKVNTLSPKQKVKIMSRIPLQRCGQPQDIAHAILFLIHNAHITGQVISIDGGQSL